MMRLACLLLIAISLAVTAVKLPPYVVRYNGKVINGEPVNVDTGPKEVYPTCEAMGTTVPVVITWQGEGITSDDYEYSLNARTSEGTYDQRSELFDYRPKDGETKREVSCIIADPSQKSTTVLKVTFVEEKKPDNTDASPATRGNINVIVGIVVGGLVVMVFNHGSTAFH